MSNPYDVEWDYGELYDAYIEEADWSLVFDAEYYKQAFPMLATLYHENDELLLEHHRQSFTSGPVALSVVHS